MATTRDHILDLLSQVSRINAAAIDDIHRADRIDALDSIDMAAARLSQARAAIVETLPPGMRA